MFCAKHSTIKETLQAQKLIPPFMALLFKLRLVLLLNYYNVVIISIIRPALMATNCSVLTAPFFYYPESLSPP